MGGDPATERRGTAGFVHKRDDDAQKYKKYQNTDIVGIGKLRHKAGLLPEKYMVQGPDKAAAGVQRAADDDPDEE